jgi:ectoine hydroxylase-related dioxygenase (phytanoyl-CoA dioxygenase family)
MKMSLVTTERNSGAGSMPVLHANGKSLDTSPSRLGRLTPTAADTPVKTLRDQYRDHGYLWLKGFLDPQEVTSFRAYVFKHLDDVGLIAPGSEPALGLSSGQAPRKDKADRKLMALVRSAAYDAFCVQPRLWTFMDEFLEGLSYLHKRKIMRYTQPHTATVTPAHYDLIYLRGGTSRVVTAWIPIGDVPVEMGGVFYLEGSHAIGRDMEAEFTRKAVELTLAERFNTRWLIADYEAGDIVIHSPFMIHASTTNVDPRNRIRLSTDIRFQNVGDEIDARWSSHWSLNDML